MQHTPDIIYNASPGIGDSPEVYPVNDHWQARRELAAALRRLNDALLTADVPTDLLKSVAASVRADASRVERHERKYGKRAHAERLASGQGQMPHMIYEMSPVLGQCNAIAPPMVMWLAEGHIHGQVTPGWAYEGPVDHLHGGVIAMLFDQLLGTGAHATGGAARTGILTIRYHQLTPLNRTLRMVADVDRVDGRKKFLVGELWAGDVRTASCEGIFIVPRKPAGDSAAADEGSDAT